MTDAAAARARIALRPATPDDEEFLVRVYGSTRAEELERVPWSDEQKDAFVRMQFAAQDAHYRAYYEGAEFFVVMRDDEPIGRLYLHRRQDELRIVDIALLPEARGDGIGTALLERVFADADAAGVPVRIHVEVFNRAMRLYERLGFSVVEEKGVYNLLERPVGGRAGDA